MKNRFLVLGVVLLLAVGVGAYILGANNGSSTGVESDSATDEKVTTEGAIAEGDQKVIAKKETIAAKEPVYVNEVKLKDEEIATLEKKYKTSIAAGSYWYDSKSGAWGKKGGPTEGYLGTGEAIGGTLRADASGAGATGVFINGRELHATDVKNLNLLFAAYGTATVPGRYWVDGQGNFGNEGQTVPLGNLLVMTQGLSKKGGGGSYYKSSGSDYTGFGGGGGFSYFGSKNSYSGTSDVYVNENGSVDIYYEPKSSDYSSDY